MIDLSKHIQEGARLELEAMERLAEECSFCSSMSAQHNAQAMRIDELQADLAALRAQLDEAQRELTQWRQLDLTNWKGRAERAEAQLAERDAELAALKGHAEAITREFFRSWAGDVSADTFNEWPAIAAYRADFPGEK